MGARAERYDIVKVEIDKALNRDVERLARYLHLPKSEVLNTRLRRSIAAELVALEQHCAARSRNYYGGYANRPGSSHLGRRAG